MKMENTYTKNFKRQFEVGEQVISIEQENGLLLVALSVKTHSKHQENGYVPLLSLENGQKIPATRIVSVSSSSTDQFQFHLINDERKDMEISTVVSTNEKIQPWIHFNTTVLFKEDYCFPRIGPEILINFKQKTDIVTNARILKQPTRHTPPTDEWKSNDMPAATIWNPDSKIQTYFFVDFSQMEWMSPKNIERFSIYECGLNSDGSFGLIHRIPLKSPITFSKGTKIAFDFYFTQEFRQERPSEWEAVEALVTKCLSLIPGHVPFPRKGLTWTKFSEGCIQDLMKENYCWIDKKFPKYFAYVMDDAEKERRRSIGRTDIFETMTLLSLLPPWVLYLQINPNKQQAEHVKATCKTFTQFIDKKKKFLFNNLIYLAKNGHQIIKPTEHTIGDSWYFFEPILRFGWLIQLLPTSLKSSIYPETFKTMVEKSIDFVHKHQYEITAFYDPITLRPLVEALGDKPQRNKLLIETRGEADIKWKKVAKNYACLGIFIYIMIEAFYLYQEARFLVEAKEAAKKMFSLSPDQLFWEPFELAYGVAGFAELARITRDDKYLDQAKKLLLNELRMFYWYNDNSYDWKNKRNNLGLPMACIGIRYPAMKENVESIYPWLIFIKVALVAGKTQSIPKDILKFFNLIRINSFYFFSRVIPQELIYPPRRTSPCSFIPFEDLEMLETPPHFTASQEQSPKGKRTGTLGREIYGAGEVLFLYLMFEALGASNNRDIMVLNLDLFDFPLLNSYPPDSPHFILYNPLSNETLCTVLFPRLRKRIYKVKIHSIWEGKIEQELKVTSKELQDGLSFTLGVEEALIIELKPLSSKDGESG